MTRRQLLRHSLGAVVASSVARARTKNHELSLGSLSDEIAELVRKRFKGARPLTILYPRGCLANIKPVAEAFTKATSVALKFRQASLDYIITEMTVSHHVPERSFDIGVPATFGIPDLAEAKVIAPLDELARRYEPPGFQTDALFSLGDYYRGSLYGYQTDGDTYLMFYNRVWLEDPEEQRGYQERYKTTLAVPRTWAELDRQVEFFHRPTENKYGGSLFRNRDYIAWEFWMRLHGNGSYPVDDRMRPLVDSSAGVRALESLIDVSRFLEPKASTQGLFENFESFGLGNKYCNVGWGGTQKYLHGPKSRIKNGLLYAPAPGGLFGGKAVSMPFFNWGWNYTVSSKSAQKELAYLFCLYACSPSMSKVAVREPAGYFDPFRQSHYQDPIIEKTYGRAFLDAHRESMAQSLPDFYVRGQGQYLDVLKENLHGAYLGHQTPKRALDITAKQWNQITDRLGRNAQVAQWRFLKLRYPKAIRDALK